MIEALKRFGKRLLSYILSVASIRAVAVPEHLDQAGLKMMHKRRKRVDAASLGAANHFVGFERLGGCVVRIGALGQHADYLSCSFSSIMAATSAAGNCKLTLTVVPSRDAAAPLIMPAILFRS